MFVIFACLPASAANYSSPGEAFFCGFMEVLLFGGIAFIVSLVKKNKKDTNE
jgi:hypothetical protein